MVRVGSHQPDWDQASPDRTQLSFIDAQRAYFNAKIEESDVASQLRVLFG